MSQRITQLDDVTVRQIAAGEVVERPASVVKELVENSLDADANRIDVTVESGGTDRIAVSDDGIGMSEADLRAAVREHTTSKIEDAADLDAGVTTLGFRGEALHTIGAVSRVTITSKPRDGEAGRGTELRLAGGEVESVGPAGCPEGTTVEVADLFYNTPARRKYLKTTTTEFSHVNTVVTRYALANPDVAVSLTHDGREVFATTGRGDLRSALLSVYGREVAESMIRADGESGAVAVSGYVSDPETTRSTREYMSTYVNGRYVSSPVVREAVLSAYGGQLSAERYPFAVLFVEVPPSEVDVNVHPRKMECRWSDESAVKATVETAVEEALLDHGLVRSSAPRGRSAPDEASVAPERTTDESDAGDRDSAPVSEQTELTLDAEEGEREQSTLDGAETTSETAETTDATPAETRASATGASGRDAETGGRDENGDGSDGNSIVPDASDRKSTLNAGDGKLTASDGESPADPRDSTDPSGAASATGPDGPAADRKFSAPTESETLAGGSAADPAFDTLPRMRVLGQLHDTYVVAETPDGLVLVDQHAADERVNYERLRAEFEDDATTQMLARPVELELTAGEAAVFDEYREALERLGFRAERVTESEDGGADAVGDGEGTDAADSAADRRVRVRTAPTVLDETLDPALLRDALGEFVSTDPDDRGDTVDAVADDLLADLACYPSITGNTSLREGSVVELLGALDDCENPYACPHGRPVVVEFGEGEIEDRFERDYPGHAGRRGEE
ncbi:DNA mismatch repair endonuclease MutL [Halorussus gelatinilyticus]|uniref:DNA mismatch repair protein MutL n=1 Tax=Halorussus gelatinilyticus TaxID=2937524 RepID=A0A8U0IN52_9EURY|nr:DNA mismatch repair endonuclease MutL [Halorussus gelatinilyticus]UPW02178.1 DNA mismatch repair endonuclease MutL [Halorussus gelatinilyticus]